MDWYSKKHFLALGILWVFGLLIFFNVFDNALVWDDEEQVKNNHSIQSLHHWPQYFLGSTFGSHGANRLKGVYYKPMMTLSYALVWQLDDGSPQSFHVVQVILYLYMCSLLYFIFTHFFGWFYGLFLSLLLAVHPMTSEVARYVADYQDVLFCLFGSMAFLLLTVFRDQLPRFRRLLSAAAITGALFLSLLSKESGVLFVGVFGLYAFLLRRDRLPLVVVCAAIASFGYFILRLGIAGYGLTSGHLAPITRASFTERLLTIPKIWSYYFTNLLWPYDLGIGKHWVVKSLTLHDFFLPLAFVFLVVAGLVFVWRRYPDNTLRFFVLWFLMGLLFHSQFFPLDMTVTNRWFLFSYIGLLGTLGFLFKKVPQQRWILYFFLIATLALGIRTRVRNDHWQNGLTLFQRDIQYSPNSFDLNNNLGTELYRARDYQKACNYFKRSTELAPHWWTNWNNLGVCFQQGGDWEQAKAYYALAIKNGDYFLAVVNYAKLLDAQNDLESLSQFLEGYALRAYPNNPELLRLRAKTR